MRIDWADLDLFGHVNNVAFFRYFQAARVSYCESIGLSSIDPAASPGFMVAASACQFNKPLKFPGEIEVRTRVDWIKNTSFQLHYLVYDQQRNIAGEGQDVIVVFDHAVKAKIPVSAELREAICAIEGHLF